MASDSGTEPAPSLPLSAVSPGAPGILSHPTRISPAVVSAVPSSAAAAAAEFTVGDNEDEDGLKHLQQVGRSTAELGGQDVPGQRGPSCGPLGAFSSSSHFLPCCPSWGLAGKLRCETGGKGEAVPLFSGFQEMWA